MKKVIISFTTVVCLLLAMITNSMSVAAKNTSKDESENMAGETLRPDEEITNMDEDGNVIESSDTQGAKLVSEKSRKARGIAAGQGIVNFRTKSSANENTNYTEEGTGSPGYTNGYYAADGAYLEHSADNTKVKFMQAGVIGWVNASEVEVLAYSNSQVQSISYYKVVGDRIMHYITTNLTSASYANSLDVGPASAAPSLKAGKDYYSYDGHYFYEETNANTGEGFENMLYDYRTNSRANAVNANAPYYNYFQFLSHRSLSNYSVATIDTYFNGRLASNSKMRNTGVNFVDNQNTYGVNALLMIGVAANESAWGTSPIAMSKNNLFGHSAYDSDPSGSANGYSSPAYSIYYHAAKFISYGYLDPDDSRYYGSHLGDKGSGVNVKYASDPYWGEKAANVAWSIDRNNGNKDAFKYTIGIKDTINSNHTSSTIRKENTVSSAGLYTTYPKNNTTYSPSNYPFIVIGEATATNGFYRIQSDVALRSDRTAIEVKPEYNFTNDYGYMPIINTVIVSVGGNSNSVVATGIKYSSHVQDIGWQSFARDGELSGTNAQSKRLEAMKIELVHPEYSGSVQYQTHIQDIGWQDWRNDGAISGTNAQSKRLEAIRIRLTGEMANQYDIYYQVHAQDTGWMGWAKNGESAGTAGYEYRLEAIKIVLVGKGGSAPGSTVAPYKQRFVSYQTHVQDVGWQGVVYDGNTSGTSAQSKRLEAINLALVSAPYGGSIQYRTHIQDIGWQDWRQNGQMSGTSAQSKRLEAIQIGLTGEMANQYDIYYRVHAQDTGWMGWAKNGESAGTAAYSYRLEAIQVVLVVKGGSAPGSTDNAFKQG